MDRLKLTFALCLLAPVAQAADELKTASATFTYQGKPVHPACLSSGESWKSVDLNACAKTPDGRMKVTREGKSFSADAAEKGMLSAAYSSYEVLGSQNGSFLIDLNWSGGGSGRFSELLVVRLAGSKMILEKQIAGGDRCNGGLADRSFKNGALRYSLNLTPHDMAELAGPSKLEAYKDLSASAASCVATADYEYALGSAEERLASVSLTGDGDEKDKILRDREGWTNKYKYDHCFNEFYNSYVRRNHTVLTGEQIAGFANGFKTSCVK